MKWKHCIAAWAFGMAVAGGALAQPAPRAEGPPSDRAASPSRDKASQGLSDEARSELNWLFKTYVVPRFAVRADDWIDGTLRSAAESMRDEHLPRVQALMERWTLEELKEPHPERAIRRATARLIHEFGLWGRDSDGPAYDEAMAQVLQLSGMCRPAGKQPSDLVRRLFRWRQLPEASRQEIMNAERRLLARWGQARQVDATEPLPAEESLLRLRMTGETPARPLPAAVAYFLLGEDGDTRLDPVNVDPAIRCAIHQWAGASPAQFRAAMALQAADFHGTSRLNAAAPDRDDDPYPRMAAFYGIRGLVTVQAELNAQGKPVTLRVVQRDIKVPGVRGVRPFAHEGMMDLASLAKARSMDWSSRAQKEGQKSPTIDFQWSLPWD